MFVFFRIIAIVMMVLILVMVMILVFIMVFVFIMIVVFILIAVVIFIIIVVIIILDFGRGYVPAEVNEKYIEIVGTIPMDAIYGPVLKVSYAIEPCRVGQRNDYDKLILEIWTDSTVRLEDVLGEAAKIAKDHFGKQGLAASSALLQPGMATPSERPVSRQSAVEVRFSNIVQLLACHIRPVEWNTVI